MKIGPLMTRAWLCVVVSLLMLPSLASGGDRQHKGPTPQAILKKTAEVYASSSSFQDVGLVMTTFQESTGERIEKQPFKLFFRRPNRFRFEWLDFSLQGNGRLNVVWSNGKAVFAYWEPDRYEKKASLKIGIAAAAGVSSGAAHTIPTLLMPQIGSSALTELTTLVLVGDELFEGEWCYRIKGFDIGGDVNEVWISKKDYLVRRVRTHLTFEDFSAIQDEIHRSIKINQPIAEDVFNFSPPIALSNPKTTKQ